MRWACESLNNRLYLLTFARGFTRVKFGVIIIRLYHRTCTNFEESFTQISIPYSIFFCSILTSTPHFGEMGSYKETESSLCHFPFFQLCPHKKSRQFVAPFCRERRTHRHTHFSIYNISIDVCKYCNWPKAVVSSNKIKRSLFFLTTRLRVKDTKILKKIKRDQRNISQREQ